MSRLLPDALSIKSTTEKKTEISGQNRAFCPWDSQHPLDSLHGRLAPAFFPITTPAPLGLAYPSHHPPGSKAAALCLQHPPVFTAIGNPKMFLLPFLSLIVSAPIFSEQLKENRSAS